MPVTARLSKLFYERLGEQIANELVDWFNQVDATYRADLRELNERNWTRFEAKLEQRLAELKAEIMTEMAKLGARLDARMGSLETRMDSFVTKAEFEKGLREQLKWMLLGWLTLLAAILAAILSK